MDLNIPQISNILGVSTMQVYKYIYKGHLLAEKKNGLYTIKEEDFDVFFNGYFLDRHKKKGIKIPNKTHIKILKDFVKDLQDEELEYQAFYNKYHNIDTLIPPLTNFLLIKRNQAIYHDNTQEKMMIKDLALKYKLSEISIKLILKKQKEENHIGKSK